MTLKAYQIVNFNNPLAMQYLEHSQRSFEPVKHLITIEPIQCVTPDTLPVWPVFRDATEKKVRSLYEQACFASHYNLIKKLADGDTFFIMEQDAYLWPDKVEHFETLLYTYKNYTGFYLGIANEFYTLNSDVAKVFVDKVENNKISSGPLSTAFYSIQRINLKDKNLLALMPLLGQQNRIGYANDPANAVRDRGHNFDAPITQHYILSKGSTIKERANNWKFSPLKNPDMYFTE